jgi:hypothetical protein
MAKRNTVQLLIGATKIGKTAYLLKRLSANEGACIVCQDCTPIRFKEIYASELRQFRSEPLCLTLQQFYEKNRPPLFLSQPILFTDYFLQSTRPAGCLNSYLTLAAIALRTKRNVFAEITTDANETQRYIQTFRHFWKDALVSPHTVFCLKKAALLISFDPDRLLKKSQHLFGFQTGGLWAEGRVRTEIGPAQIGGK